MRATSRRAVVLLLGLFLRARASFGLSISTGARLRSSGRRSFVSSVDARIALSLGAVGAR